MPAFLERQKYLIDYTLAALLRRKTRNLGLLLVYALLVFLFSSVLLLSQGLRREAAALLQDAPALIVQRLSAGRHDLLPADWLEPLRRIRGVSAVQGRLWGYYYDPAVKANYTIMVAPDRGLAVNDILIGAALARTRQLGVGDYLSLPTATGKPLPLKVIGILDLASELLSADLLLLSEEGYRSLFNPPPDTFTDVVLTIRNPREARTVAEKIALALPGSRPILRAEILRTYDAVFNWREGIVFVTLSAVLLAFMILAWDKAAGLSAEEQREIGILKAVGWETGDILRMKLWEGALLSLTAFLTGYLLAYWQVFYGGARLFAPVLKGWAVLYPDFRLTPAVNLLQVLALLAVTVLPYVVATLIPIWRAATADPDAVMRG
ncbi:MAG: FtsX-like permease family protein [Candidatus Contendobacter sp.]|jgi:ABC-type lipoprotein release transport system permease subunit|nr:FtsX-like permease family protein [Gammaproteobacteria bacterium]MCC8994262.1 FtsX-like permease family protein [Candidatus Contendobacter sp.]